MMRNLKNLRLADLELFITAARLGNLGKSARMHHLSQSAASSAVQRLERVFDVALCTHEKRQFCLTRQGKELLPKLEQWIQALDGIVVSQEELPIRLVTNHSIAQIVVGALLSEEGVEISHMRPDEAYAQIINHQADVALVLDNASWSGVVAEEIACGAFQLYAHGDQPVVKPVLLPEDQMEVLALQQSWQKKYGNQIPIKSRIASWSLIASTCINSSEVGFLPDFVAKKLDLEPVNWQPATCRYRILALFRSRDSLVEGRLEPLLQNLRAIFAGDPF